MHACARLDFPDDGEFVPAAFVIDRGEVDDVLRAMNMPRRTHIRADSAAVNVRHDEPALTNGDELPGAGNSGGRIEFGGGGHAFGG